MTTSGCGACQEEFGSLELFDKHQHWDRAADPWTLTCAVPEGLVRDEHGIWQTPEGLARRRKDAARLAAARAAGCAQSGFQGQDG